MAAKENDFSPQESLKLIAEMIEKTKSSISDRSHYFLLWGWAVAIGCLLQYYLKAVISYPHHYYAWLITPVAIAIHFIFVYNDKKKDNVKTFINEANAYLWTSIGLSFFILDFVFAKIGWQYCYPFYILFYAIGTYISGSLIKFRPLIIGGLFCFVFTSLTIIRCSLLLLPSLSAILFPVTCCEANTKNKKNISYERK